MGFFTKGRLAGTLICLLLTNVSAAEDFVGLLSEENWPQRSYLIAQEDAYDPFVDFSEFEEASEEEADINFFRNGRFFTLGFVGGYRIFTSTLGNLYDNSFGFGLFLSYFFDLRFALQLTFLTGDHTLNFTTPAGTNINGNVALTSVGFHLKYYLNTQNVTRGLAQLNPYFIGGFTQVTRTVTVSGQTAFGKDGATAFEIGGGIELPTLRNKMYVGFQTTYQLVSFPDENSELEVSPEGGTGVFPTGDILNFNFVLGVNF